MASSGDGFGPAGVRFGRRGGPSQQTDDHAIQYSYPWIHGIISILNAKILRAEPGRRAEGATRGSRKAQRDRRYEEGTAAARVGAEARLMKKAGYFEVQRGTSLSLSLSLAC